MRYRQLNHSKQENGPKGEKDYSKSIAWIRLLIINAIILLILLVVVFIGMECYYRLWYDETETFGRSLTYNRWLQKYYLKNNRGFRDSIDYALMRGPQKHRVTFLGDSFTAGHGIKNVEDRFANHIRWNGKGWEVHVFADSGMDTGDEIEILERAFNAGYQGNVMVLVYCLNDISDIMPEWSAIMKRVYGVEDRPNILVRKSYFFNTIYYRLKGLKDPDVSRYYQLIQKAYEGPSWKKQKLRLMRLYELVKGQSNVLAVVIFPFMHVIGTDYPYQKIHEKIGKFWQNLGVPFLDLLNIYENHPVEKLIVNRFDAHPNSYAHKLAAKAITEFLESSVLDKTQVRR